MASIILLLPLLTVSFSFFFNDTATTEIYTLSLHDALPIFWKAFLAAPFAPETQLVAVTGEPHIVDRSEEHTSELQSQSNLVCRLLLEKKKKIKKNNTLNICYIIYAYNYKLYNIQSLHIHV